MSICALAVVHSSMRTGICFHSLFPMCRILSTPLHAMYAQVFALTKPLFHPNCMIHNSSRGFYYCINAYAHGFCALYADMIFLNY